MDDHERKAIGQLGEELALAHLLANGLKPLIRNYRCKMGELDLVMMERETLVLIEVRCRSNKDYGGAAASVDWQKQRRLILAAEHLRMKRAELRRGNDGPRNADRSRPRLPAVWVQPADTGRHGPLPRARVSGAPHVHGAPG